MIEDRKSRIAIHRKAKIENGRSALSTLYPQSSTRTPERRFSPAWPKLFSALGLALLSATCSTVPDKPQILPSVTQSGPTPADINRNLAAAAMLQASASSDYQIGPEDLLEITLFNIPEGDGKMTPRSVMVRVSQQGQVSLPLLGEISAKGLTVSGLEQRLRGGYDKYIYNPQVGVLIKEYRQRVSVIGAVQKPGVFELTGPKTIIDLLAMAGGLTERAGSQAYIYRQRDKERETHIIDLAVLANTIGLMNANSVATINLPVQAGDMINIPEAGMFFVDGAVRKPGSYALGRRYSLTQALATAGGVDHELNSNDISIFRRQGPGDVQNILLSLSDVMSGNVADPQIQPDDVIIVPTSTAKYIVKRFVGTLVHGMSISTFISGS
jgi:polysaccharide export outer membrane protein